MALNSNYVGEAESGGRSRNTSRSARCSCGRCVRAAGSTWAAGDIVCGLCLTTFADDPAPFAGRDQSAVNEARAEAQADVTWDRPRTKILKDMATEWLVIVIEAM